jgi:hypothetical protein
VEKSDLLLFMFVCDHLKTIQHLQEPKKNVVLVLLALRSYIKSSVNFLNGFLPAANKVAKRIRGVCLSAIS